MERKKRKTVSNSLCVLVSDQPCTTENIIRLENLLKEGADINFNNAALDNDTPLHIAISKDDAHWVEVLIQHGADKTVKNDDGKSAVDIETDNAQILLLLRDNLRRIDKKYVKKIIYESRDLNWNEIIASCHDPLYKILKISNFPTVSDVALFLTRASFYDKFNNAPFLFVIIIELLSFNKQDIDLLINTLNGFFKKPMLIQIACTDRNLIYHKEEDSFVELSFEISEIPDDIADDIYSEETFNFEFIAKLLCKQPNIWGHFHFDLLLTEVNIEESVGGTRLVDFAVQYNSILALKFLQLFDQDLSVANENRVRPLEIAVEFGSFESLKILLDHSENEDLMSVNPKTLEALNLFDQQDCSLLMIATEAGNANIVRFLLNFCPNLNYSSELKGNASDIAWRFKLYEILFDLLVADGPFPHFFDTKLLPNNVHVDKINSLIALRNYLHNAIKNNDVAIVQQFISDFPNLKCVYDSSNQSALTTTLQNKSFDIYSMLRCKGYSWGIDSYNFVGYLHHLSTTDKQAIRDTNKKYFNTYDSSHIMDLLSKSRLSFQNDQKHFVEIKSFYETLDLIPEVQPVLKTVANAKKVDVMFDFHNTSISDMDPSKVRGTRGTAYHNLGNIFISAGHRDKSETLGTLAHEFTHYAMLLTYNNNCKPFRIDNSQTKEEFEAIVRAYDVESFKSKEKIIALAYTNSSFDVKVAELIVRVPHLLALYRDNPTKIQELKETYKDLFDFYINKTLPDLIEEYPVMKTQRKCQELNKLMGLIDEVRSSPIYSLSTVKIMEITESEKAKAIITHVPRVILTDLVRSLKTKSAKRIDATNVFIKIDQLIDVKNSEIIQDAFEFEEKPLMFVLKEDDCDFPLEQLRAVLNTLNLFDQIVLLAAQKLSPEMLNIFPETHTIDSQWNDLHEDSKEEILNYQLSFHGIQVVLKDIIPPGSAILPQIPLHDILKLKNFSVNTTHDKVASVSYLSLYIERTFVTKVNGKSINLTTDQLMDRAAANKVLIIAESAGMGKSMALLEIAKKLKERNAKHWICFIDLKQHTICFVHDEIQSRCEISHEFFSKQLLQISGNLESKIFEHFYQNGKVIFLFDGFDEISPNYKEFVVKIFQKVRNESQNQIFISTRLHLCKELKEVFKEESINLKPFSNDDRIKFLTDFWRNESSNHNQDELKDLARNLLVKFEASVVDNKDDEFSGNPLQLRMLAEIFHPNQLNSDLSETILSLFHADSKLNLFILFELFVKKLMRIWSEKGPLANNESLEFHATVTVPQIHQTIALKYIFDKNDIEEIALQEVEPPLSIEMVARIGIFQVSENAQFEFVHQAFAEYFVADFLLSSLLKNRIYGQLDAFNKLWFKVLKMKKFENIRKFLNAKLDLNRQFNGTFHELTKSFNEFLKDISNQSILENFIVEENAALIKFLLTTLQIDNETKSKLIAHINRDHDTPLHVAVHCGRILESLWNCVTTFMTADEQKQLLFVKDNNGMNVLFRGIFDKSSELSGLKFILNTTKNLLNLEEFKSLLFDHDYDLDTALHRAACLDNEKVFETMWTSIADKLPLEDQKSLLFIKGYNKLNILNRAIMNRNVKLVLSIYEKAQNLCDLDGMKSFWFARGIFGDTALNTAVRYTYTQFDCLLFNTVWNLMKQTLTIEEQKRIWLSKTFYGSKQANLLFSAIEGGHKELVETILTVSQNLLNAVELESFLTFKNNFGVTLLQLSADRNQIEIFPVIWKLLQELLTTDQLRSFILRKNLNVESEPTRSSLKAIFIASKIFTGEEIETIFSSVIYEVSQLETQRHEVLETLISALTSNKVDSNLLTTLIATRNEFDDTAVHLLVKGENNSLLLRFWDVVEKKLGKDDQKKLFFEKGFLDEILLFSAMTNSDSSVLNTLWTIAVKLFNPDEIKQLLKEVDHFGRNFFHWASWHSNFLAFTIFDWYKLQFGNKALREIFRTKTRDRTTLFQFLVRLSQPSFIQKFFLLAQEVCEHDDLKQMFFAKGYEGYNALGYSVHSEIAQSTEAFWMSTKSILSLKDLEQLAFDKNDNGKMSFEYGGRRIKRAVEELRKVIIDTFGGNKIEKYVNN